MESSCHGTCLALFNHQLSTGGEAAIVVAAIGIPSHFDLQIGFGLVLFVADWRPIQAPGAAASGGGDLPLLGSRNCRPLHPSGDIPPGLFGPGAGEFACIGGCGKPHLFGKFLGLHLQSFRAGKDLPWWKPLSEGFLN